MWILFLDITLNEDVIINSYDKKTFVQTGEDLGSSVIRYHRPNIKPLIGTPGSGRKPRFLKVDSNKFETTSFSLPRAMEKRKRLLTETIDKQFKKVTKINFYFFQCLFINIIL